jgi:hypothetical protein
MKKQAQLVFVLCVILLSVKASAQMVLENVYGNAWYGRIIRLEQAGYKYIMMDDANNQFRLYNLDHTLYKTVHVPQYTGFYSNTDINWVSEYLFNSDNLIEYVVYYGGSGDKYDVVNENGVVLTSVPGGYGSGEVFVDGNNNHKLLLHNDGNIAVFALPGGLPCIPNCSPLGSKSPLTQHAFLSEPVPNPGEGQVQIQYVLPFSERKGLIQLYNAMGQAIVSYEVMSSDKELTIYTEKLIPGTYYYNLSTGQYFSEFKTLIIIK